MNIGVQIHHAYPSWDGILKPPRARPASSVKPPAAFWTSSLREDGTSAWWEWASVEIPDAVCKTAFAFEPVGRAELLLLRNECDFRAAFARAGMTAGYCRVDVDEFLGEAGRRTAFWRWVRENYDGVHVPEDRDEDCHVISRYDCECTAWFRPHDQLRPLGILSASGLPVAAPR